MINILETYVINDPMFTVSTIYFSKSIKSVTDQKLITSY